MTKETAVSNLDKLRQVKRERYQLLMRQARKYGQLRVMKHLCFLLGAEGGIGRIEELPPLLAREIEKEEKDLALINEELRTLKHEINALQYEP